VIDVEKDEGCCGDLADAPGAEADVAQGFEGGLSREFPRSPTARFPLWALLRVFCSSVSVPPWGFLTATVIVSASPS
jgi:hypothetical protein